MHRVVVWMVVVVTMRLVAAAPAPAAPPATPLGYALFGLEGVRVGARQRIQGDVGCSGGTCELTLGAGAHVTGAAAATTIKVGRGARASAYFCTDLRGKADVCSTLPVPLVAPTSLLLVQVSPGVADVSLDKRAKQASPLAAGAYGVLRMGAASTLVLAGGAYSFAAIDLGPRAKLSCAAACEIDVRGGVRIGQAARLGGGPGPAATSVLVQIQADGESTALEAKSRARVTASVYAPTGAVELGAAGRYDGAFVGQTVAVGSRARVTGPAGT